MSEFFSQVMSLLAPKYERVTNNDSEWHQDLQLKQQYRTGLRTLEEARPPPVCAVFPVCQPKTPQETPNIPSYTSDTTQTTDHPECEDETAEPEHIYDTLEEIHKTSDLVNLVTEKKALNFDDIFPSINEILNDHGIKDKLKNLSISAKNKTQKEEADKSNDNFLSKLRFTMPTFNRDSTKLYPLEQSKDKTVQTYYPGV